MNQAQGVVASSSAVGLVPHSWNAKGFAVVISHCPVELILHAALVAVRTDHIQVDSCWALRVCAPSREQR